MHGKNFCAMVQTVDRFVASRYLVILFYFPSLSQMFPLLQQLLLSIGGHASTHTQSLPMTVPPTFHDVLVPGAPKGTRRAFLAVSSNSFFCFQEIMMLPSYFIKQKDGVAL